jgi:hypothetical protein
VIHDDGGRDAHDVGISHPLLDEAVERCIRLRRRLSVERDRADRGQRRKH